MSKIFLCLFLGLAALANATPVEERGFFRSCILFIAPESDHWLPLSLTHVTPLTDSCLVDLIDVTRVCEDANSKLVEVVTIDRTPQSKVNTKSNFGAASHCKYNVKLEFADQKYGHGKER